jgi:hypothetical protein
LPASDQTIPAISNEQAESYSSTFASTTTPIISSAFGSVTNSRPSEPVASSANTTPEGAYRLEIQGSMISSGQLDLWMPMLSSCSSAELSSIDPSFHSCGELSDSRLLLQSLDDPLEAVPSDDAPASHELCSSSSSSTQNPHLRHLSRSSSAKQSHLQSPVRCRAVTCDHLSKSRTADMYVNTRPAADEGRTNII